MIGPNREHPRLTRLTNLCLKLPETSRRDTGDHASFLVRKKVFAYYLDNHHGDGIVSLCTKVMPGENAEMAAHDERYFLPAYIGPRGWVGLRLDVGRIRWAEVNELVGKSYRLVAPKRLGNLTR